MACQDRMLSVFSSCGRRLLPSIQLATPVSALHCSAHFVMVLTAGAMLSVWSVLSHTHTHTPNIAACVCLVEAFSCTGGSGVGSSCPPVRGTKQHSVSLPVCRDVQKQKALVKNESLLNILSGEALRKSTSYFINSLVSSNSCLICPLWHLCQTFRDA